MYDLKVSPGPEAPAAKREPSPEGPGSRLEDEPSALGAALTPPRTSLMDPAQMPTVP